MITLTQPRPTPKAVWKRISHIVRMFKYVIIEDGDFETFYALAKFYETTYDIDEDYILYQFIIPAIRTYVG